MAMWKKNNLNNDHKIAWLLIVSNPISLVIATLAMGLISLPVLLFYPHIKEPNLKSKFLEAPQTADEFVKKCSYLKETGKNRQTIEQAIEACTQAIIINANLPEAYLKRGSARLLLGEKIQAIADYQKAKQIYLQIGNPQEAEVIERYLLEKIVPNSQAIY